MDFDLVVRDVRLSDSKPDQPWAAESWPEQPSAGMPYRRGSRRTAMIVAAVVVIALAITIAVLAIG